MRCILKHLAEGILGVPYYSINAVFVTLDDGGSLWGLAGDGKGSQWLLTSNDVCLVIHLNVTGISNNPGYIVVSPGDWSAARHFI